MKYAAFSPARFHRSNEQAPDRSEHEYGNPGSLVATGSLRDRSNLGRAHRECASLPDQHSSRCQSGRIDPCMVPKGLAAAVLASAVKIAPNFPMAAAISNLLYTILIYSILGTVIAILAVEATGRRSGPLRMALSIRERAPLTRRLEAFGPQYGVFPVRLLVRRGHLPSGKLLARSWTTILDSARF